MCEKFDLATMGKSLPLKIILILTVLLSFSVALAAVKPYEPHQSTCPDECICASAAEYYKISPTHKAGPEELCGGPEEGSQGCGEVDAYDNPRICWQAIPYCGDGECAGNETASSCEEDCEAEEPEENVTEPAKPTGPIGAPQCGDCTPTMWGTCTATSPLAKIGTQSGTCKDLCENTVTKTQSCEMPDTLLNGEIAGIDVPIFIGLVIGILVVAGVVASMRKKPKGTRDEKVPQFRKLKK
ncbi:MAG: hypothetical protein QXH80_02805 [Candidatus Nanoarchaeia archaeon]